MCIFFVKISHTILDSVDQTAHSDMAFYNSFFTKQQNFTPVQILSICRRQNKCDQRIENCSGKGKKNIVGQSENADYQHFLLFPQCFQKAFFLGS